MTRYPVPLFGLLAVLTACTGSSKGDDTGADADADADTDADSDSDADSDADADSDSDADTDADTDADADIAVTGTWADDWGGMHEIDNDHWNDGWADYWISQYDNDEHFAVAENGDDSWLPGNWSRFDWTYTDESRLFFCQSTYDAESQDDALAADPADSADLDGGCDGWAWSELLAPLDVRGSWADGWGTRIELWEQWAEISSLDWGGTYYLVSQFDNDEMYIISQSTDDDTWSRFDWTFDDTGAAYFCQSAWWLPTEDDAIAAEPADGTDLAGGCSGFSWSPLLTPLDIRGVWADQFGWLHTVDEAKWSMESGAVSFTNWVSQFDNDGQFMITQSDTDLTWARTDWTWGPEFNLWYCTGTSGAATEDDAIVGARPDDADLNAGCDGFGWSKLMEPLEIRGEWDDAWGQHHVIDEYWWYMSASWGDTIEYVSSYDNYEMYLTTSSAADGTFSRFDWTWDGADAYYCWSGWGMATEEDAMAVERPDELDLTTGCGGVGWDLLVPSL